MTQSNESGTGSSIRAHLIAIAAATVLLVGGIGVIDASTELACAIIASGTLVVESNVKKVQHPTGGIVGELLVQDGTRVKAGDLIVRLDETAAQANVAMVSKSLAELWARRARLEAERDSIDEIEFPPNLMEAAQDPEVARVVTGERRLFELRREAQQGQKAQLRERIAQFKDEVRGYTDQAATKKKEIEFIQKELEGVRDLWQKNLIPINRVTALERDAVRLEGERGQLIATIAQAKGKISEIELQIIQIDQNARSEVAKELADVRAKIAADIIQDQRNNQPPYYLVRVSIAEGEIARLNGIKLVPGMPVEAFIRTDERTVWSYLLKPLTDQARRAFREH